MKRLVVEDTPLAGLKRVRRTRLGDSRGFLARLFCADELAEAGWAGPVAQVNHTRTLQRGSVRGLHFQQRAARREEARPLPARRGVGRRRRPAARLADLPALARRGLERRERRRPAHSRRLRARPADARRRRRHALLPLGRVRGERRGRPQPARPAPGDRLAAADRRALAARRGARVARRRTSRGSPHEVPPLRRRARARLPRPRQRAAVERLPERGGAARARALVSAAPARLRALLAGPDRRPRRPRSPLQRRLRLLQLVLVVVAGARRAPMSRRCDRASR